MGVLDIFKLKTRVLPVELTTLNFNASIKNSPVPVLVDFYSNTCLPCRQMAKTVTKFATDFQGRIRVGAFNIEQDTEGKIVIPNKVRAVPTLIIFVKGEPVETFTGLTGYLKLQESLEKIEAKKK
ncbi:MAG TPA: thioredoxin domain-containing protein [bacterium]|nr:thioredoxin domain-containing protein [bacterium]HPS29793.1 thioredoxin domain-containing protein [bacterium]